jgi:hypothetical protein
VPAVTALLAQPHCCWRLVQIVRYHQHTLTRHLDCYIRHNTVPTVLALCDGCHMTTSTVDAFAAAAGAVPAATVATCCNRCYGYAATVTWALQLYVHVLTSLARRKQTCRCCAWCRCMWCCNLEVLPLTHHCCSCIPGSENADMQLQCLPCSAAAWHKAHHT